ncbi:MAG: DUF2953 domain-containing protein [Bacillota bacterium]
MVIYILIALLFIFLTAFIPIQIHILYHNNNQQGKVKIKIKILFITVNNVFSKPIFKVLSLMARRKFTVENVKESVQAKRPPEKNWILILKRLQIWTPRMIQIISHSLKLTSKILKPIKCKKLNIYTEIGLTDAAKTGITIGTLWGTYSYLLSMLSKWMVLKPDVPKIEIIPDFKNPKVNLKYDCIITFPLGHIIIVMVQTIRFVRVSYHLIKGVTT